MRSLRSSARRGADVPLGLRVDVDTHDGMRDGVPRLLETFDAAGVRATFYLSMGPDRAGMAVLNLLRRGFLSKMTRTRAASVYGWRTILSGTLLPARPIATALPGIARRVREAGHEVGVHAWDHRRWQDRLLTLDAAAVAEELDRGRKAFLEILGAPPKTFAAPAWLSRDEALLHEETFALDYASDCRGKEPFLPIVGGRVLATPQVPATLPTLDEALGDTHEAAEAYYRDMLDLAARERCAVFTLHAELEGGPYAVPFLRFLREAGERGIECAPLGRVLAARRHSGSLDPCPIVHVPVRGRHGVVSMQAEPMRRTA